MKTITSPEETQLYEKTPTLFLAGGITGCPPWQEIVCEKLAEKDKDYNYILFNPRRKKWDMNDKDISERQILWEHKYLLRSDVVAFWFPKETLCPITLFELGLMLRSEKRVIVGTDPEYQRRFDLDIQIPLYKFFVKRTNHLDALVEIISKEMRSYFL